MWMRTGLIVTIVANIVAASELQCVVNFFSEEKNEVGVVVYIAAGGYQLNPFDALVDAGDLTWTVINHAAKHRDFVGFPGNYLILGSGNDEEMIVKTALNDLSHHLHFFEPSARMIVVLSSEEIPSNYHVLTTRIITMMWEKRVYDTVVVFVSQGIIQKIFSANPFATRNRCGLRTIKLLNLTCGDPMRNSQIWSHPERYSRCTLSVSRRETPPFSFKTVDGWRGADQEFLELIVERKNIDIKWSERPSPESGLLVEDVHRYYEQIVQKELDLAVGGIVMTSNYLYKVQYMRPYDQHTLLYYVADAELMRGWKVLHTMFPTTVWCVLWAALVLGGLTYSIMIEGTLNLKRTKFLMLIAILVTQSMQLPRRWRLRLLMAIFLLPLYHISSLHSTALQSFMLHAPKDASEIRTESDLRAANLTVYSSDVSRVLTSEVRNEYEYLKTSTIPLFHRLNTLELWRNFSILARSLDVQFYQNIKHYRIHSLTPGITVMSVSMVMGRGHLYFNLMDELVQQCLEVGLFSKWVRDLTMIRGFRPNRKAIDSERAEAPLDLDDLECAFIILMVGHAVAWISFIFELLLSVWQQISRQKISTSKSKTEKTRYKMKFKYYVIQKKGMY